MPEENNLVLLVEDSPTQALCIQVILEKNNMFEVKVASSAPEAIGMLQAGLEPVIIVADIIMPEMDGFEFTTAIRADERFKYIPVLLSTANPSPGIVMKCLSCGADSYVPKPITPRFVSLISHIVSHKKMHQDNNGDKSLVMQLGDEVIEISAERPRILNMLYSALLVNEEKDEKIEELSQELRNVKRQLRTGSSAAAAVGKKSSDTGAEKKNNVNILIVDDTNINRVICSRLLDSLGYRNEVAEGGRQAIELMKERYNDFDLIFTDCQMPDMDGYEMTRVIRKYEQENGLTGKPIIALTANVHRSDRDLCFEAGMNDFLSKPFRKPEIDSCIKKWSS